MKIDERFWSAPVDALKRGYQFDQPSGAHICLICGEQFEEGTIYQCGGALYTAERAAALHVRDAHGGMFEYFLNMSKAYTGLTEHQVRLIKLFADGLSDKEVVNRTSANSTSTIRNQRFALRERYKQAKVMVAMMELFEDGLAKGKLTENLTPEYKLTEISKTATIVDERYAITQAEKDEVLNRYFDADGNLIVKAFPAREKRKIIILQHLTEQFAPNEQYTEKQVNAIIARYYDDVATVRRYMIQYGFMDRETDGSAYWVKL